MNLHQRAPSLRAREESGSKLSPLSTLLYMLPVVASRTVSSTPSL